MLCVRGTVIAKELLGSVVNYSVRDNKGVVFIVSTDDESYSMGQELYVGSRFENIYLFDSNEQRVRAGDAKYASLLEAVRRL